MQDVGPTEVFTISVAVGGYSSVGTSSFPPSSV